MQHRRVLLHSTVHCEPRTTRSTDSSCSRQRNLRSLAGASRRHSMLLDLNSHGDNRASRTSVPKAKKQGTSNPILGSHTFVKQLSIESFWAPVPLRTLRYIGHLILRLAEAGAGTAGQLKVSNPPTNRGMSRQQKRPPHIDGQGEATAIDELVSEVSAPLSAAKWCDDRSNNT